ncbi:MAG: dihydroxyacetone kinase subunit DhaK [Actinobacteria bacterium]|nr:dihydroxyacetone kinase subunit DhaK [Actinomycetota bacterium]
MKKFINNPLNVVDESLEGYILSYPDYVRKLENSRVLIRKNKPINPKVVVITGGGSGHKPAFIGYIGEGLVDGVAVGEIFSAPPADYIYKATKELNMSMGVIYLYGNFSGDLMNFRLAKTLSEAEGISVEEVVAYDDIASAPKKDINKRRAIAGEVIMWKIGGSAAEKGMNLSQVKEISELAAYNTRSIGVGTYPPIIPATGRPGFILNEDEMEIGVGHHGEPGIKKEKIKSADEITDELMSKILEDLPFKSGDKVSVLINSLGATPYQELFIISKKVSEILNKYKIKKVITYVGEYFTSLEMAGFSITLTKLDDNLEKLILAKADSPLFKQFQLVKE